MKVLGYWRDFSWTQRIDAVAVFFFIVLAIFLPMSNAVIESSFGVLFLCFLLKSVLKWPTEKAIRAFFANKINLSLVVFYLCIGLSIFISPLLYKSFKAWFFKWGEGVLLFYFAQVFLKKRHIVIILMFLLMSTFLMGLDGFYQKITGADFIFGLKIIETPSGAQFITAVFKHYNDYASFLIVMLFIALGMFRSVGKKMVKVSLAILCAMIAVSIFLTYSRGAWLSLLLVYALLVFLLAGKKERIYALVFLAGFSFTIFTVSAFRERFIFMMAGNGDAGRLKIWGVAFEMFKKSPFLGQGIGTFMDYVGKNTNIAPKYAHNCYLQILAETGLVGLISFFWFIGAIIFPSCKRIRGSGDYIFAGLFSGLLVFLVHSFFDTQFFSIRLVTLFWLLCAFVAVYLSEEKGKLPENKKL